MYYGSFENVQKKARKRVMKLFRPSNKPSTSDWQQQKLRMYRPQLSPRAVIAWMAIAGATFVAIGLALRYATSGSVQFEVPYGQQRWSQERSRHEDVALTHRIDVVVPANMPAPVYVFFRLTEFHQNHREYVKSKSKAQLEGSTSYSPHDCEPIVSNGGKTVLPCGLGPNTIFNDTVEATVCGIVCRKLTGADWSDQDLAWPAERRRYHSREPTDAETRMSPFGFELPGAGDERMLVWLQFAAFPTFLKPLRTISRTGLRKYQLLTLHITDNFPVPASGSKALLFTTGSWLGVQDHFLEWAYLGSGMACLMFAAGFGLYRVIAGRALGTTAPPRPVWERSRSGGGGDGPGSSKE